MMLFQNRKLPDESLGRVEAAEAAINFATKRCLPFDRSGGKFYMTHGSLKGKVLDEATLPQLLQRGELWECNMDKADEVNQTLQEFLLLARFGLDNETKEELKSRIKNVAQEYCSSCKRITKESDLTPVEEKVDISEVTEFMLGGGKGKAPSLYSPFRPEYILFEGG